MYPRPQNEGAKCPSQKGVLQQQSNAKMQTNMSDVVTQRRRVDSVDVVGLLLPLSAEGVPSTTTGQVSPSRRQDP